MSLEKRYLWRVYCLGPPARYETIISEAEPTTCPSGGEIDPNETIMLESLYIDLVSEGYVNIESLLSDNQAVRINASNTNGGMVISSGFGGTIINSTNAINISAAAASSFSTTLGNLDLEASAGLTNIDAGSGINLGNKDSTDIINIGTPFADKTITIGNQNANSQINVRAGGGGMNLDVLGSLSLDATGQTSNFTLNTTGDAQNLVLALTGSTNSGIIIDSAGIGEDSIRLLTPGGIHADAAGTINLATAGNMILDASFNGGTINISAGAQGVSINATGTGVVGIGHWSGGDIYIGTADVPRNIIIGNTNTTTSVTINSGTGGINIGNNENTGQIQIGNSTTSKTIVLGNNASSSRLYTRYGLNGWIKHQESHVDLQDTDTILTYPNLLVGILAGAPTANRILTLPDTLDFTGLVINDALDFTVINTGGSGSYLLQSGVGGSIIGLAEISPSVNISGNNYAGSAQFKLRIIENGYIVYRLS